MLANHVTFSSIHHESGIGMASVKKVFPKKTGAAAPGEAKQIAETAFVLLWQEVQKGVEKIILSAKMLERHEDLEETTARQELEEFLYTARFALERD